MFHAGDTALSIEFLLLARQLDQACDVAAAKGAMDVFARLVADSAKVGVEELSTCRLLPLLTGRVPASSCPCKIDVSIQGTSLQCAHMLLDSPDSV